MGVWRGRVRTSVVGVLLLLLLAGSGTAGASGQRGARVGDVPFRVLISHGVGGCQIPCYTVFTHASGWAHFWRGHGNAGAPPAVDWSREAVALVGRGRTHIYNNTVEVRRVERRGRELVVAVEQTESSITDFLIGTPYEAVAIPRPAGGVRFVVHSRVVQCLPELLALCGQPSQGTLAAGGRCSPPTSASLGVARCYSPARVRAAEASVPRMPVDPSAAVARLTGLRLGKVAVIRVADVYGEHDALGYAVHFLYGTIPPAFTAPISPRAKPTFLDVVESADAGEVRGQFLQRPWVDLEDVTGLTGPPLAGPWEWWATLATRGVNVVVLGDAQPGTIRTLGEALAEGR